MTPMTDFYKVVGAGNDFVVVFLNEGETLKIFEGPDRAEKIKKICDRVWGVGADGIVFLEETVAPDKFRWHFFNRDGSSAELCGNAARAVTRLLIRKTKQEKIFVQTAESEFYGTLEEKNVVVEFKMPIEEREVEIEVGSVKVPGLWVKAGVPHFVPKESLSWEVARARQNEMAKLRHAHEHGALGANVTVADSTGGSGVIKAITFERGVEDFTLACGTGAIAAAWAVSGRAGNRDRVLIQMPGGMLSVQFLKENKVRLIGEGCWVYSGVFGDIFT